MSNTRNSSAPKEIDPKQSTDPRETPTNAHEEHADEPVIRHEHAIIHPASTGVTHVDPGAIIF